MFGKRRHYIQLFEKGVKAQQAAAQAAVLTKPAKGGKGPTPGAEAAAALMAASPPLTPEEQAKVDLLEETVPLDSLVVWRTIAHAAMRRQAKLLKVGARVIGHRTDGWVDGWMGGWRVHVHAHAHARLTHTY